ncbi:uncharacterized protein LOC110449178 [Mizuhopecten yessoensis]|uniref:Uncharacterized protein n=1 Tax=Mizuhopecten yessoensis TaxID=6573 RepID=A0A210QRT5_MIZYE|nr:uncharacterized protein LOC110449178 [Mizuhopecten yessoensis]OWF51440.1 hypothetical protein KP79_PYT09635 [Mizuhopecten yessoensis]
MTVLCPATKPPCLKADKRSVVVVEPDHDFAYSLDLMGDYTLKVSDHYKEPSPFWFEAGRTTCRTCVQVKPANLDTVCTTDQRPSLNKSLDTTCWHPQQFTPETDIGIVLDTTQDDEELDSIMNNKRGYTYINNSRHRGLKRRIAYDDEEEVPIPCKRPRSC